MKKILIKRPATILAPNKTIIVSDDEYLTLAVRDKDVIHVFSELIEEIEPDLDISDLECGRWIEYHQKEIESLYKIFHPKS